MKKMLKVIVAVMLLMLTLVAAGCGGGDKYAGTWKCAGDSPTIGFDGNRYIQIVIEKNGDKSYIIKNTRSNYHRTMKRISGDYWKRNDINDATFTWKTAQVQQYSATLINDKLVVDGFGGLLFYTQVEKDGSLLCSDHSVFTKEKADDVKNFKEAEQKRILDLKETDKMQVYRAKNIGKIIFTD